MLRRPCQPEVLTTRVTELLQRLKYGSVPWNAWRREHPDDVIVLDHADLNGMILIGIDLEGALHIPPAPS